MKKLALEITQTIPSSQWNTRSKRIQIYADRIIEFTCFLKPESSISERLYCIINDISNTPVCKCGSPTKFTTFGRGYGVFCSRKCSRNSISTKNKQKETCIQRYGVDNPQKSLEVQHKTQQTKRDIYGDMFYTNRDQSKETCIERYGVEHYTNRDQSKETCIERYGKPYYMIFGSEEWYANMFLTHGVFFSSGIYGFMDKVKDTKESLYGDRNYNNRPQARETCLDRYGVDEFLKSTYFHDHMTKLGRFKTPEERSLIDEYYRAVRRFTKHSYKNHEELFCEERGFYSYHLDHICSIVDCFNDNIPPFITGSIHNLQLIPWMDNLKKNRGSEITSRDLVDLYYREEGL